MSAYSHTTMKSCKVTGNLWTQVEHYREGEFPAIVVLWRCFELGGELMFDEDNFGEESCSMVVGEVLVAFGEFGSCVRCAKISISHTHNNSSKLNDVEDSLEGRVRV